MVDQALLTAGREHTKNTEHKGSPPGLQSTQGTQGQPSRAQGTGAALQGCGAQKGHEGSPPGPRRAQGTGAALQEKLIWSGPSGDTTHERPSRRHKAGAALQGAGNKGGPPGRRGTRAALQGAGNKGGPPGNTKLERPSRAQGTRVALQGAGNKGGPPGNTKLE